jgi:hypothetical protein
VIKGGDRDRRLALLTNDAAVRNARLAAGCDGIRVALRFGHTNALAVPEIASSLDQLLLLVEALEIGQNCIVSTAASDADFLAALKFAALSGRTSLPEVLFVDATSICRRQIGPLAP